MRPRSGGRLFVTAALAAALLLPTSALAAGPGGGGTGGGGTGGGGTGGGGTGGGDETDTGSLYSEMIVALRKADGTPDVKRFYIPGTEVAALADDGEEVVEASTHYCVQPVSYTKVPGVAAVTHGLDGRQVYPIPLQGELIGSPNAPAELEPCDPKPEYAMYVSEAELERLNLTRTSDDVVASKLAEFVAKWQLAKEVTLDPAGRIAFDGAAIDASPDYAALYSTLMKSGGIKITDTKTVTTVSQEALGSPDFRYGPLELAAVSVGTAAGKYVPITVDTIQYYNRIVGFTVLDEEGETLPGWEGISFIQPGEPPASHPDDEDDRFRAVLPGSEHFVDYGGFGKAATGVGMNAFTYNRSTTFPGSVTWLDVPTLTWQTSRILDVVDYTNLTDAPIENRTLTGVTAFAQMADDVRATIVYLHENEVIAGFYMDPVGIDTTEKQENALKDAAVDLKDLPATIFPEMEFPFSASLYNPWGGVTLTDASMRLTLDAPEDLSPGDVSLSRGSEPVELTVEGGDLVATFAAPSSVSAGYRQVENLLATVHAGAPVGEYDVTLELLAGGAPVLNTLGGPVQDAATMMVQEDSEALFWAADPVTMASQGSAVKLPLKAYSPTEGLAELTLRVSGPGTDPVEASPTEPTKVDPREILFTEAATHGRKPPNVGEPAIPRENQLSTNSLTVYGVTLDEHGDESGMAAMPLHLEDGRLVGYWPSNLLARQYTGITWYLTVAEFAPLGVYTIEAELAFGAVPTPVLEVEGEPGVSVTFSVTAAETVDTYYRLLRDGAAVDVDGDQAPDQAVPYAGGPVTLDSSADGDYRLEVWARDKETEKPSRTVFETWTVDTTAPVVTVSPVGRPGSGASFTLTADEDTSFECMLTTNGVEGAWEPCTSPKSYTGLAPGTYLFSAKATDAADNVSDVKTVEWTVESSGGSGGGGVISPPADPGTDDPVVPPVGPGEPGDGDGEGGPPDTFIGKGPQNRSFVLGHSVTYRLRSNGEDVQYRVSLNNRFAKVCDSNVCVVDGLKTGRNVLRFAAEVNGQRDDTPAVRTVYVPRNTAGMKMTERWTIRKNVRAFEGDLARTNQEGQVIRTRAREIKRIALVVAKGKGNGQVEVFLGQRLLTSTPIDLSSTDNQHQVLVPVKTFRKLQTGTVRVRVVSQGKPVRIEGIGIVNR